MPDFAPDATPRYVAKYLNASLTHSVLMRLPRGTLMAAGVAAAQGTLAAFFAALAGSICTDFAWVQADWIPQDSSVATPAAIPAAVVGTQGLSGFSRQDKITSVTWTGRGTGGSRVRYSIFGVQFTMDVTGSTITEDFIFKPGESAPVDAATAVLNGAALLRAIDNTKPIFRGGATIKVNDHWLRAVRRGGV